jgi:hypothetical protein
MHKRKPLISVVAREVKFIQNLPCRIYPAKRASAAFEDELRVCLLEILNNVESCVYVKCVYSINIPLAIMNYLSNAFTAPLSGRCMLLKIVFWFFKSKEGNTFLHANLKEGETFIIIRAQNLPNSRPNTALVWEASLKFLMVVMKQVYNSEQLTNKSLTQAYVFGLLAVNCKSKVCSGPIITKQNVMCAVV